MLGLDNKWYLFRNKAHLLDDTWSLSDKKNIPTMGQQHSQVGTKVFPRWD